MYRMHNYYIRADGLSRTKDQLMNMLGNQDFPELFTIQGVVDELNPVSVSFTFFRNPDGYSYSQMQVLFHPGLPAAGANQFIDFEDVQGLIENITDNFGPNAVAINAPPMEDAAFPGNNAGPFNVLPQGNLPQLGQLNAMVMHGNNNNIEMGEPQAGGRGRRRRISRRRKVTRRTKAMSRRRASQRRRR